MSHNNMDIIQTARAVLIADAPASENVAAALQSAREEAVRLTVVEEEAKQHSLDPLTEDQDEADEAARLASLRADRCREAVRLLEAKYNERKAAEAEDERIATYDKARLAQKKAEALLRDEYPEIAEGLMNVIGAILEADILTRIANRDLPAGRQRLLRVEGGWQGPRVSAMLVASPDPHARHPLWQGAFPRSVGNILFDPNDHEVLELNWSRRDRSREPGR